MGSLKLGLVLCLNHPFLLSSISGRENEKVLVSKFPSDIWLVTLDRQLPLDFTTHKIQYYFGEGLKIV